MKLLLPALILCGLPCSAFATPAPAGWEKHGLDTAATGEWWKQEFPANRHG
jgi:hypothetical protein